jgi:hypothetical protein
MPGGSDFLKQHYFAVQVPGELIAIMGPHTLDEAAAAHDDLRASSPATVLISDVYFAQSPEQAKEMSRFYLPPQHL